MTLPSSMPSVKRIWNASTRSGCHAGRRPRTRPTGRTTTWTRGWRGTGCRSWRTALRATTGEGSWAWRGSRPTRPSFSTRRSNRSSGWNRCGRSYGSNRRWTIFFEPTAVVTVDATAAITSFSCSRQCPRDDSRGQLTAFLNRISTDMRKPNGCRQQKIITVSWKRLYNGMLI